MKAPQINLNKKMEVKSNSYSASIISRVWEEFPSIPVSPYLMGMTNLILSPFAFVEGVKGGAVAHRLNNRQGMIENGLTKAGSSLGFVQALTSLTYYGIKDGILPRVASSFLSALDWTAFGLGSIGNVIGLGQEGYRLHKQRRFFCNTTSSRQVIDWTERVENGKKREVTREIRVALKALRKKHFKVSKEKLEGLTRSECRQKTQLELLRKKHNLARRVQPWCATQMEKQIPSLLKTLKSKHSKKQERAIEKSLKLFETMRIQTKKKLLLHVVGIIAALFLILTSTVLTLCVTGYAAPIVLIVLGILLTTTRFALHTGFVEHAGWHFSLEECFKASLPDFAQKTASYFLKMGKYFLYSSSILRSAF